MAIDKKALRDALAHYQAWNDEKLLTQILQRGQQTPEQKWQAYQDLYAFGRRIKPQPSWWEQIEKAEGLKDYYAQIQKFEAIRRRRATRSAKGARSSHRPARKK